MFACEYRYFLLVKGDPVWQLHLGGCWEAGTVTDHRPWADSYVLVFATYCWWFRNPGIYQLRLVVYPIIIHRDLCIPSGCFQISEPMLHTNCDRLMASIPNHQPADFAAAKICDAQWKSGINNAIDNKWVVNNPWQNWWLAIRKGGW